MGWFSKLKKGVSSVAKLTKVPVLGSALKAVPFVGGALALADVAGDIGDIAGYGSSTKLPTPGILPASFSPSRFSQLTPRSSTGRTGIPGKFSGPAGRFQLPGTGPTIPEWAKAFAMDDSFLKTYYRAPKGYVVVKDANGKPYPILKTVAKQAGIWKASKKPPMSVKDWESLKRANRSVNKIKKINKMAKNVANFKPK